MRTAGGENEWDRRRSGSVHKSAILIDTQNDVPIAAGGWFDIGKRLSDKHTDLPVA